jgi:hypothetical protein
MTWSTSVDIDIVHRSRLPSDANQLFPLRIIKNPESSASLHNESRDNARVYTRHEGRAQPDLAILFRYTPILPRNDTTPTCSTGRVSALDKLGRRYSILV